MNTTRRDSLPQQTEEETALLPIYRRPKDDISPVEPCVKRQPVKPRRVVLQLPGGRSLDIPPFLYHGIERKHSLIVHGFIRQHCRDCPREVGPDVVAIISELTDKCASAVIHMVDLCLRPANNGQIFVLELLNDIYLGECRVPSEHMSQPMVWQALRLLYSPLCTCSINPSNPSRKPCDLVIEIARRVLDTCDPELVLKVIRNFHSGNFLTELVRGLRFNNKQGRDGDTKIIVSIYGRFQQTRTKIRGLISTQYLQHIHSPTQQWRFIKVAAGLLEKSCVHIGVQKRDIEHELFLLQEQFITQLCKCAKSVHPKVAVLAIDTLRKQLLYLTLFQDLEDQESAMRSMVSSVFQEAAAAHGNHAVRCKAFEARECMAVKTEEGFFQDLQLLRRCMRAHAQKKEKLKEKVDEEHDDDDTDDDDVEDDTDDEDY